MHIAQRPVLVPVQRIKAYRPPVNHGFDVLCDGRRIMLGLNVGQGQAGIFFAAVAQRCAGGVIEFDVGQRFHIDQQNPVIRLRHDAAVDFITFGELDFRLLALGDIRTNGDVLLRLSVLTEEGDDGSLHPVKVAILGLVTDFALPDSAAREGLIHRLEEAVRMFAGIYERMILSQQLLAGVTADFAKLVVDVGDFAPHIGSGDNGMLIQSIFLQAQLIQCTVRAFRGQPGGEFVVLQLEFR